MEQQILQLFRQFLDKDITSSELYSEIILLRLFYDEGAEKTQDFMAHYKYCCSFPQPAEYVLKNYCAKYLKNGE